MFQRRVSGGRFAFKIKIEKIYIFGISFFCITIFCWFGEIRCFLKFCWLCRSWWFRRLFHCRYRFLYRSFCDFICCIVHHFSQLLKNHAVHRWLFRLRCEGVWKRNRRNFKCVNRSVRQFCSISDRFFWNVVWLFFFKQIGDKKSVADWESDWIFYKYAFNRFLCVFYLSWSFRGGRKKWRNKICIKKLISWWCKREIWRFCDLIVSWLKIMELCFVSILLDFISEIA